MANDDYEKYGLHEPEFNAVNLNENNDAPALSKEKIAILQEEKNKALGMIKIASFDGRFQDPYPSPFLNLSDMEIPRTAIEIFRWCKYFFMFDPLISGAINALSTFPVTEIYLEDKNSKNDNKESDTLKTYKRVLFKNLSIYKLLIEIGIDYYLYGNCFVFGELWTNPVTKQPEWKNMVKLDPSKMIIDYNPATREKVYKWQIPQKVADIVRRKKPVQEYNKIPNMIKLAVKSNKALVLNSANVYHFSRPTDSMGDNTVWGTPIIANVLKLLMYRNILRQAQEAIAREHIVPLRVYYIAKTDSYNVDADWNKVANDFAGELNKAVRDPNHKVVSPVPINVLNVGGEGKQLLLTPEIEQVQSEILAGMNMPREFIFGGVSYSGSSISLKILENQFITYRLLLKDFIQNFIIKGMAKARKEWVSEQDDDKLLSVKMMELKMQDDVQQKQLVVQLNAAGKITNEYMWKVIGIDPDKMKEALQKEALAAVSLETIVGLERIKSQLQMQKAQIVANFELQLFEAETRQIYMKKNPELFAGQPTTDANGNPVPGITNPTVSLPGSAGSTEQPLEVQLPSEGGGTSQNADSASTEGVSDGEMQIQNIALQLLKLPPEQRQQVLKKLPIEAQQAINQQLQQLESARGTQNNLEIDMRPMPEQKPPRRNSLK
jgi:hypothetical protein